MGADRNSFGPVSRLYIVITLALFCLPFLPWLVAAVRWISRAL